MLPILNGSVLRSIFTNAKSIMSRIPSIKDQITKINTSKLSKFFIYKFYVVVKTMNFSYVHMYINIFKL